LFDIKEVAEFMGSGMEVLGAETRKMQL